MSCVCSHVGHSLGQAALKEAVVALPEGLFGPDELELSDALDAVTLKPASLSVDQLEEAYSQLVPWLGDAGAYLRGLLRRAGCQICCCCH